MKLSLWDQPDGCTIHPTCVTCPLEICIYDDDEDETLARRVIQGHKTKVGTVELASRFGITQRRVKRILEGVGNERQRTTLAQRRRKRGD